MESTQGCSEELGAAIAGNKWIDQGEVLKSFPGDDFNAIDPNIFEDTDGRIWLNYGSFWTGLKQVEIDAGTGRPIAGALRYDLATRPGVEHNPIEGASMTMHNGYFYLFASIDYCCTANPAVANYKQVFGRSTSPHGPFVDIVGTSMMHGGGTVILGHDTVWNAAGGGNRVCRCEWRKPAGVSCAKADGERDAVRLSEASGVAE